MQTQQNVSYNLIEPPLYKSIINFGHLLLLPPSYPIPGVGDCDERSGLEPMRGGGAQPHEGPADVAQGQDQQVVRGGQVLREHVQPRHEVLPDLGEDVADGARAVAPAGKVGNRD